MPRKRKSNLSQSSKQARVMKKSRLNETFQQAELRRLEQAEREADYRAAEKSEQTQNVEYLANGIQQGSDSHEQAQARRPQQATCMTSQRLIETVEVVESRGNAVAQRAPQRRLIFTKKNRWGVIDKAVFEYDETLDYENYKLIKIEAMPIRYADFAVLLNGKRKLQTCVGREAK
ncbi:hypothetical protein KGM_204211 [Danaus plexippus plexippus]|uniref:Uncharacterized protein n=1 Tax=Danaus plexippus plexippus TaxID=278856 RepID=A0A212EZC2_DANPL|nr:hypothetical protein KGM_204211 [Danaus plexippus plexippus]